MMSDDIRPDLPTPDEPSPDASLPKPADAPKPDMPSPDTPNPDTPNPDTPSPATEPSSAAAASAGTEADTAPGSTPVVPQEPWLERWLPRWPQLLLGLCVVLILADLLHHKHGYFPIEETRLFQAWAGVLITLGLAIVGTILRGALGRPEGDDER